MKKQICKPLRPAGRAARPRPDQHDVLPRHVGCGLPFWGAAAMVYRDARPSVAAVHLLGVHPAVRFLFAHGASPEPARVRRSFGAGALVTAVTVLFMPEDVVLFGVLTLLGSAMGITALLEKALRKIPPAVGAGGQRCAVRADLPCPAGVSRFWRWLGAAAAAVFYTQNLFTAYLGFLPGGFFSTDYFPLLPWLFLFWVGSSCTTGRAGRGWSRCAVRSVHRWAGWADTRWGSICCISR